MRFRACVLARTHARTRGLVQNAETRALRYHDNQDVPDEESRSTRSFARCREGRMAFVAGSYRFLVDLAPHRDVFVQLPFLLVDERLHVDGAPFANVFDEFHFGFVSFR